MAGPAPDVAADVIKQMPIEQSAEVLAAMGETDDVVALLRYPDESAGGLMTTDFPQVRSDITTGNALDVLRIQGSIVEHIGSIYVVDRADKLMGSLSVTRLALARPNSIIARHPWTGKPSPCPSRRTRRSAPAWWTGTT